MTTLIPQQIGYIIANCIKEIPYRQPIVFRNVFDKICFYATTNDNPDTNMLFKYFITCKLTSKEMQELARYKESEIVERILIHSNTEETNNTNALRIDLGRYNDEKQKDKKDNLIGIDEDDFQQLRYLSKIYQYNQSAQISQSQRKQNRYKPYNYFKHGRNCKHRKHIRIQSINCMYI